MAYANAAELNSRGGYALTNIASAASFLSNASRDQFTDLSAEQWAAAGLTL